MIIFLFGEDSYRSSQKLAEIKQNFKEKTDPSGINIAIFDGADFDLEKFSAAASQTGFLAAKRLIIVKNLLLDKPDKTLIEQLTENFSAWENSENIIVFYEGGAIDKTLKLTKLFKLLLKSKSQEFAPLDNRELTTWVLNHVKEQGGKIGTAAVELLISAVGNNLWQLTNELDKLLAYKNNGTVAEADIKLFVIAKITEDVFGLTDALATGNKKMALLRLKNQEQAGLNEVYLTTMFIRQFRILAQIKSLLSNKVPESQIASKLKLHPYVVKKSLPLAAKFTLAKFQNIYRELVELDQKLKSTSIPGQTLLEMFVCKI